MKGEAAAVQIFQKLRKQPDVVFQPDLFPNCGEMFLSDTSELRIMEEQIAEFATLLDQLDIGKTFYALLEIA